MDKRKLFWSKLCLVNLAIVALLGFTLRSKILFPIPWIDYRSFLSAHSHFAFSGWVGLALTVLLIYNLLPPDRSSRKIYVWVLAIMELTSLGMAVSFPLQAYGFWSILFSSTFIVVNYVFAAVFIKDILRTDSDKTVKLLSIASISSLLISAIGPFGLAYILITKNGDSFLYRDSIYTFLHFQYNGFFTLAVFSLYFQDLLKKGRVISTKLKTFATILSISVIPSLFLSLLWHGNLLYYAFGAVGCVLLLLSLFYYVTSFYRADDIGEYSPKMTATLLRLSFISFGIKILLNAGTIIPSLGNAVYGDRPVIIGFLHLVFLAFVSFFILAQMTGEGIFTRQGKLFKTPLLVFISGVFLNEILLMVQGLGILLMTNSDIYNWLLWIAAFVLFCGGLSLAIAACKQKSHSV
jgi:hypothetical protein